MADKITLATVSELQAFPSAAANINSNSAIITAAMDNTLSRDGTSPNQMGANLDMNSFQILNIANLTLINVPTSSSGLPTGTIWNNAGALHIV